MKPADTNQSPNQSWWKRQSSPVKAILIVGAILVASKAAAVLGLVQVTNTGPASSAPTSVAAAPADPGRISMEQYKLLSTGMSYQDAVRVLGSEAVEMSSNDIGGTRTVMYQWKAGFMANMNATFQNDKLVSKAQFGLK